MPSSFASVAEYLAAKTPDQRAEIESLRALVMEADPELVEILKWNSPSYTLHGVDRLTIHAANAGPVRLIMHFGARRVEDKGAAPTFDGDPEGLLRWHSDIRASLTLPPAPEFALRRDSMLAVIRAWLAYS